MSRLLENLTLTTKSDKAVCPAEIKVLTLEDLDEVESVQAYVYETLDDKDFYYPLPRDILALSLGTHGMTVGTFAHWKLIGFRSILYPRPGDENLGEESGLTGVDLEKVAHLERTVVHPEFRGNGLQRRMTGHIIEETIRLTRWLEVAPPDLPPEEHRQGYPIHQRPWRYLFSTVAPKNYASMKDKFTCGMVAVRLELRYSDLWRYVFFRDILEPTTVDANTAEEVDGSDLERQIGLIKEGYVAYGQHGGPGDVQVRFARPVFHTLEMRAARRLQSTAASGDPR